MALVGVGGEEHLAEFAFIQLPFKPGSQVAEQGIGMVIPAIPYEHAETFWFGSKSPGGEIPLQTFGVKGFRRNKIAGGILCKHRKHNFGLRIVLKRYPHAAE